MISNQKKTRIKQNSRPPVSVVITNFNGGEVLIETIESVLAAGYPGLDIVVADDGSTDNSLAILRVRYPGIRITELGRNTRRLNMVRNAGIKAARHDLVLLIDNDIILGQGLIERLVEVMGQDHSIAAVSPRLQYSDDSRAVYWDGGLIHYLAASICFDRGASPDTPSRPPERNLGCGNVLLDRSKLAEIGYFDNSYWLGWADDGEIYFRLLAAGYECLHVSDVKALHIAKERTTERLEAQLHNRWMFMLKNYQLRTLLLSLPPLIVFELMQIAFCLLKGATGNYLRALGATIQECPGYLQKRSQFARTRKRKDRDILVSGPLYIAGEHVGKFTGAALKAAQFFFNLYWAVIKPLL